MTANELIPESQLERVISLRSLVLEFRKSREETGCTLREFVGTHGGVSISTLCRMNRIYDKNKSASVFVDKRKMPKTESKSRIDRNALSFALCYISEHPRSTIKNCWEAYSRIAEANSWAPIGYKQLQRAIKSVSPELKCQLVEGSRAVFEKFGAVKRKTEESCNGLWVLDVSEIPVYMLDLTTGELFKPFLFLAIDAASRALMGFKVFRNSPTSEDVLKALHFCLHPKNDTRAPFWGIPEVVSTDNGSIFTSTDWLDVTERLTVSVVGPNYCPSFGGKIERAFKGFKQSLWSGLVGYSQKYKALSLAKKGSIPFNLLDSIIWSYIHAYNHSVHSEIGCTPFEKWMASIEDGNIRGLSLDEESIAKAFCLRQQVMVARDGVGLWGRHYNSPDLVGYVGEEIIIRKPIFGVASSVEAFSKKNIYLGELKAVEDDIDLANQISQERLSRSQGMQDLAKTIREMGKRVVPLPVVDQIRLVTPETIRSGIHRPSESTDPIGEVSDLNVFNRDSEESLDPIVIPNLKVEE